jgi:hypothetical protein
MASLLRRIAVVLLILGGTTQSSTAQIQLGRIITVDVTLGKESLSHHFKVPVLPNNVRREVVDDQFAGGEWGFTGSCPNDIGCKYRILIIADALSETQARVSSTLVFYFERGRKCQITKEFLVVQDKPLKARLKCRTARVNLRMSF